MNSVLWRQVNGRWEIVPSGLVGGLQIFSDFSHDELTVYWSSPAREISFTVRVTVGNRTIFEGSLSKGCYVGYRLTV